MSLDPGAAVAGQPAGGAGVTAQPTITGQPPPTGTGLALAEPAVSCAGVIYRFGDHVAVNQVDLTIYNRWGKVVYTYSSGGERTIYIDWDGHDDNGREVVAGVYYYIAQVTFDSVDPGQQHKSIKGWVQVVRGSP